MCDLKTVEQLEIPIKVAMCNVLQQICCRGCGEKKHVFLQSFNISKFIGVDLSVVEGLFSLLF